MISRRVGLAATSAGLVFLLGGCPNPNTYTTPRTLDPGQVQWQVAPEVIGVDYSARYGSTDASGNLIKTKVSSVWPMFPTFGARIGVAEGLEIGLRAPNLEPVAGDAKIRLLKGPVDVALDPGLQVHRQRHAVVQRIPDRRAHRVFDPRMQQEHPLLGADICRLDLEHSVERIGVRRSNPWGEDECQEHPTQIQKSDS